VFRYEDLVILIEWILLAEKLGVEFYSCLSHSEHLFKVAISDNRFTSIYSHRRKAFRILLVVYIRTSTNSIEISGDLIGFFEWENLKLTKAADILRE
jgi:hypothetical protein